MRAVIYSEKGVSERLSFCIKNIEAGTDWRTNTCDFLLSYVETTNYY